MHYGIYANVLCTLHHSSMLKTEVRSSRHVFQLTSECTKCIEFLEYLVHNYIDNIKYFVSGKHTKCIKCIVILRPFFREKRKMNFKNR